MARTTRRHVAPIHAIPPAARTKASASHHLSAPAMAARVELHELAMARTTKRTARAATTRPALEKRRARTRRRTAMTTATPYGGDRAVLRAAMGRTRAARGAPDPPGS